ncbi:ATP-grasp domain-containing protein [Ornithinimicrobium sp. F0845]|uniref:carboxylate--amine ligase n=1 Tax=Ornithinimicrobium sp. F0845 TaxID=2926412 RepID=UPI001FF4AD63|nr:ATP-grasp domain-containing protein [Ornithinimicrobium sp. F0845]MCK0110613.1 ATP-grasp domain-containing protein [Ornithinimicrobium sp. F0845]
MATVNPDPDFDVVLLGTDIGIYGLARAFHERYGIVSTVISRVIAGPIKNSRIIDTIDIGEDSGRPETLAALEREGRKRKAAGRTTLLLSNADTFSRMLSDQAEWLRQWYVVPAVDGSVLDMVADKVEFARVCEELDIPTPRTLLQDFSRADEADWTPDEVDLDFPVVAKPAVGAAYEGLKFEGKQKIYKVDTPERLREIFGLVRGAGFRDRFVVQELIPGDDTAMRSITAYMDSSGEVTLLATAQVLLQEHQPLAIGNPAAMVTTPFPELMDQAERFLKHVGYHGFANFDVKLDPRDGVMKFFEMNPRIGRNNYYVTAAGANVAEFITTDLIEKQPHDQVVVRNEILYSVLPQPLLRRYLSGEARALHKRISAKGVHHPLVYPDSLWRKAYVVAAKANFVKKYATYYPKPTDSGF